MSAPPPPPPAGAGDGSSSVDLDSDPTPSSWFNNVLDGDTLTTPFTMIGEYQGQARISTIEVSPDGGETWLLADVDKDTKEWTLHLASPPGSGGTFHLISRATDKNHRVERTINANIDVSLRKIPLTVHILPSGTGRD